MPSWSTQQKSRIVLELDDYVYTAEDPSVTLTSGFDGQLTIEARCWNVLVQQREKEPMELNILGNLEAEVAAKKVKKPAKVKGRKDRFPKDGGLPVLASVPGYAKIPWTKGTLTLIASVGGKVRYAKTMDEKRELAWAKADWILVCWPGQYTQDVFLVDDLTAFRKALGFKPVAETIQPVVQDENGEDWILDGLFPKVPTKVTKQPSIINPLDYRYDQRF